MKKINTKKSGFTIIEVVLVLAIAGLIFMMVFIAYPALRRSQRDTQRRNDVAKVVTAIQSYQASNRGELPGERFGTRWMFEGRNAGSTWHSKISGSWDNFYVTYLLNKTDNTSDAFTDPDGSPYNLQVEACNLETGECPQRAGTFKDQYHSMLIVKGGACDGEKIKAGSGKRNFAVAYKKEGGGVICQSV
jgi:prepilin-type N-terminal cleavage/methylation domain-containing protein